MVETRGVHQDWENAPQKCRASKRFLLSRGASKWSDTKLARQRKITFNKHAMFKRDAFTESLVSAW